MFTALVLAAGESSRMGNLKALLPWGTSYLLRAQIEQLARSLVNEIIVVTGYQHEELYPRLMDTKKSYSSLSQIKIIHNPNFAMGKTSSIRIGMDHVSSSSRGVVVVGVDQPVLTKTLNLLFNGLSDQKICIPTISDRKGHPPVFSSTFYQQIKNVSEEHEGLRYIIRTHSKHIQLIETNEPQILLNLNRKEDYTEAIKKGLDKYH